MFRASVLATALLCICGTAAAQQNTPVFWLNQAQNQAANLSDPNEKCGVLTAVALAYFQMNQLDLASQTAVAATAEAQQIVSPSDRLHAELGLINLHNQMKDRTSAYSDIQAAQQTIADLPEGPQRNEAAEQLAEAEIVYGGFAAARRSVQAISDAEDQVRAGLSLAEQFAQAGDQAPVRFLILGACNKVNMVNDADRQTALRVLIAQVAAREHAPAMAARMAAEIQDPAAKTQALSAEADADLAGGRSEGAKFILTSMKDAAHQAGPDHSTPIWLAIARLSQRLGDTAGTTDAVNRAVAAAGRLAPADRADAWSAAASLLAETGDLASAKTLAGQAAYAAQQVTDDRDVCEVQMTLASAEARCGMGDSAKQSIAAAEGAGRSLSGEPEPGEYLDVVHSAADANDFKTAESIAVGLADPRLRHDAVLTVAQAEVEAEQFQAAEETVRREGSPEAEAAVCGIIAGHLARTRNPDEADQWARRLTKPSDRIAADLAIANVQL